MRDAEPFRVSEERELPDDIVALVREELGDEPLLFIEPAGPGRVLVVGPAGAMLLRVVRTEGGDAHIHVLGSPERA